MRSRIFTASASALLLIAAPTVGATHSHGHLDTLFKRHHLHREQHRSVPETSESGIALRSPTQSGGDSGQCLFPKDAGLVAVTPHEENAGWAMSPNQPCEPDHYCPYACPPGQVMMQWDPSATSYAYPKSMNGGLYCDVDGKISKPFPDKPYCQDAKAGIGALNNATGSVAFCQTVLPGNEAMLIPTRVDDWTELAVPGTDYWCGTAAHYYINPPGTGCEKACVWGTNDSPIGNWSPYVAGTNVDKNGETFIKLGWNPIYLEQETPFRDEMPNWGVKIDCEGTGCNGLPCEIDPATNGVNEMVGKSSIGAGGAAFCVVTVPKGATANFVVFDGSGGSGYGSGSDSGSGSGRVDTGYDQPAPNIAVSTAAPSSSPSAGSDSAYGDDSSSESSTTRTWSGSSSAYDHHSTTQVLDPPSSSTSAPAAPLYAPHEFYEESNSTYTATSVAVASSTSQTSPIAAASTGGASAPHLSIASLLMSALIIFTTVTFWS